MKCSLDFCDRKATGRGYCDAHYRAVLAGRKLGPIAERTKRTDKSCEFEGCDRPSYLRGHCMTHYRHLRLFGEAREIQLQAAHGTNRNLICKFEACERKSEARGYCPAHSKHLKMFGELRAVAPRISHGGNAGRICKFEPCERPVKARGYCEGHAAQIRKGQQLRAIRVRTGGWQLNSDGYSRRSIKVNGRQITILQHREVMEETLGRKLLPGENVHHINGVRHDNRPENLELWSKAQPAGQRIADKLAWADEMIALYRPSLLAASQLALVA
jgi:hypothetical protein